MSSRSHGFSLAELMIVIALAAAILAIGAPNFQQFRLNNRLSNAANDTLAVITSARTEAIKRQVSVAVCRTDTPSQADAKCSATSGNGWIAFIDKDNNCTRGASVNEPLVASRALDNSITANTLRVGTDGDCLQFGSSGFRQRVGTLSILNHVTLCDSRGLTAAQGLDVSAGRGLLITTTGRARVTRTIKGGSAEDMSTDAWSGAKCS
jgi:type IV fimbrial biogenesis protein FimT